MSSDHANDLPELVREHSAAATRYAAALAKRMGIGVSELAALEHLEAAGPLTPGQLGGRLSMTAGAVTALLDRLERRGHVERLPNPNDRRSAIVHGTEQGRQDSIAHLWPYITDMQRLQEDFTEQERAVIARFLRAATDASYRHADRLAEDS